MSGRFGDGGCATGPVALPWTIVSAQNPGPGLDHVPIAEACVARGQSTMRGGSRTFSAMQCLGRLGPGLPERADRQLARLLHVGYAASVTSEDGLDVTARIRTNVVSQSVVLYSSWKVM
jgi:hypothetical protein